MVPLQPRRPVLPSEFFVTSCHFLEYLSRVALVINIWPLTCMREIKGFLLNLFIYHIIHHSKEKINYRR